eukprot:ctg_1163.g416
MTTATTLRENGGVRKRRLPTGVPSRVLVCVTEFGGTIVTADVGMESAPEWSATLRLPVAPRWKLRFDQRGKVAKSTILSNRFLSLLVYFALHENLFIGGKPFYESLRKFGQQPASLRCGVTAARGREPSIPPHRQRCRHTRRQARRFLLPLLHRVGGERGERGREALLFYARAPRLYQSAARHTAARGSRSRRAEYGGGDTALDQRQVRTAHAAAAGAHHAGREEGQTALRAKRLPVQGLHLELRLLPADLGGPHAGAHGDGRAGRW